VQPILFHLLGLDVVINLAPAKSLEDAVIMSLFSFLMSRAQKRNGNSISLMAKDRPWLKIGALGSLIMNRRNLRCRRTVGVIETTV
jgi:hypothetical protein